jgi:hypothetical protein
VRLGSAGATLRRGVASAGHTSGSKVHCDVENANSHICTSREGARAARCSPAFQMMAWDHM